MVYKEPPNGAFVLIGTNPCDILATRADAGDNPTGQWWPVTGDVVEWMSWRQMLAHGASKDLSDTGVDAETVAVRRLYLPGEAIAELVLGPARDRYERCRLAASATDNREDTRNHAQQAMAVRGLVDDLCAAYDIPAPNWSPDPEGDDRPPPADSRHLVVVPDRPAASEPDMPAADVAPVPAAARAADPTLVSSAAADDTEVLPSLRFPAGPDHLPEQTDPVLQPAGLWGRFISRASATRGRHSAQGRRTGGAA